MNDVWLKELAEEQTKRLLEYYKVKPVGTGTDNRSIADFDQPI